MDLVTKITREVNWDVKIGIFKNDELVLILQGEINEIIKELKKNYEFVEFIGYDEKKRNWVGKVF